MEQVSYFEEFARLNSRKASVLEVGGFRPTNNLSASNFGRKPLARPGEKWPSWKGVPMLFVCQFNVSTAPAVPGLLEDIKLITFFVTAQGGPLLEENGKDWRLRTYKSLMDLVPLVPPDGAARLDRACECRWSECTDYPAEEDSVERPGRLDTSVQTAGKSACATSLGENVCRTKIGGYPSHIQSELWWDLKEHPAKPKFCGQINSEEKVGLAWGDRGMVYLARGTAAGCSDQWFLDWQSY